MTSHWYAIADAGGNIYPGTFGQTALDAQCTHLSGGRRDYSIPIQGQHPDFEVAGHMWKPYTERGDHVVRCRIETDEQVRVAVEEARWEGEGGRG